MSVLNTVVYVAPKNEQYFLDGIHALFDDYSRGQVEWDKLSPTMQSKFCTLAGVKSRRIGLPMSSYSELEITKLLRTMKEMHQVTKQFSQLSVSDFK